jgi:hypothetical protein
LDEGFQVAFGSAQRHVVRNESYVVKGKSAGHYIGHNSPATPPGGSKRIGPVQNQLVRFRFLDSGEQNEDASEGTYDGLGLKLTGMTPRDSQDPRAQQIRSTT